ncbi:MAG: Octanoyltransferase [bacterium ADurb.Bin363]|nr:MAG: Octanoyltransferase [bacterium ADurb.Bin363]
MVYPIINLCEYKLKVKEFIEKLEEVIILTLEFYSIKGTRNPLNHGVWIGQDKIASIGIGIRKWITFHGFTLNINTDLSGFNMIRACGLYNAGVTSMKKIMDREFSLSEVSGIIIDNFSKVFNVGLEEIVYEDLHQRIDYCEITKTKAPMAQDQTSLRGKLQKTY